MNLFFSRQRVADLFGRGVYAGWSNANRAIFIHVPKTAGTSVARTNMGIPRGMCHVLSIFVPTLRSLNNTSSSLSSEIRGIV